MNIPSAFFWQDKSVLVTGHTGFKGSWLSLWLSRLGANVTGLALAPDTKPSLFEQLRLIELGLDHHIVDIRDAAATASVIQTAKPEILFHLAAQPLVRKSYREPLETFSSNIMGTVHVLEAARSCPSLKMVIVITTDKVYRNNETGTLYKESAILGGKDPYSASKAAAELCVDAYRSSYLQEANIALVTARAGNVIGGGDWSEDRLIPDAIKAWSAGKPLHVRNPGATRPWQHVLEPLAGYLKLAEKLEKNPTLTDSLNFGPEPGLSFSVGEVIDKCAALFGDSEWTFKPGDNQSEPSEAQLLSLDTRKASRLLGIDPVWGIDTSLEKTIRWYTKLNQGSTAMECCVDDIEQYIRQPQ